MMINSLQYYNDTQMSHGSMGKIMGTRFEVILLDKSEDAASAIWHDIQQELMRLDKLLNRFDPESEIAKMNTQAFLHPVAVHPELFQILTDCRIYHEKTMGLFDISLKDFSKVVLLESDCAVSFLSPEITLDLGAYAKGYALQVIGGKLKKYNVLNAFLSFGDSSILGIGNHPYGNSWKVSVTNPFVHHEVLGEIDLQHTSLSTSGNSPSYSNHIVRPDSGRRNNERKLVCVVAGNPVDAEVLSTALMVATDQERQEILQNFEIESFKIYNIE
jgi:thiamine biosynthesis lipoprotein